MRSWLENRIHQNLNLLLFLKLLLQEIASENGIAPSQISRWVDEFKGWASLFFLKTCLALKKLNFLKINNMNFTLKLVNLALRMIG
ncbi:MAG: hypothetical protein ACRC6E_04805 [Fusobacteriaceae bacterium]